MSNMYTNHLLLRFWQQTNVCINIRMSEDRNFMSDLFTSLLGWGVWRAELVGSVVKHILTLFNVASLGKFPLFSSAATLNSNKTSV